MNENSTEVALATLAEQMKALTNEIGSLRRELSTQRESHSSEFEDLAKRVDRNKIEADATHLGFTELRGTMRGGIAVLSFFQAAVLGASFWLFSQASAHNVAIAELKSMDQQTLTMIKQYHKEPQP